MWSAAVFFACEPDPAIRPEEDRGYVAEPGVLHAVEASIATISGTWQWEASTADLDGDGLDDVLLHDSSTSVWWSLTRLG